MTTQVVVGVLRLYRSCTCGGFSLCTDLYTSIPVKSSDAKQ